MVHPGTGISGAAETVQEDRCSHFPWQPTPIHGLNRSPRFPKLAWRKQIGKSELSTEIGRATSQRPERATSQHPSSIRNSKRDAVGLFLQLKNVHITPLDEITTNPDNTKHTRAPHGPHRGGRIFPSYISETISKWGKNSQRGEESMNRDRVKNSPLGR